MKLTALGNTLYFAFKMISFVGFIITGALATAMVYERIYKKILNYEKERIEKNKWYFYIVAAIMEGAFIYLYVLLF